MRQIPYYSNPGNACALACYTMVGQYLLPHAKINFDKLGKIGDWRQGYVIWEFPIWNWFMDQGIYITDYDPIDYTTWAKNGIVGLKNSLPDDEFTWYENNTYNLDDVTKYLGDTLTHNSFTFVHRKPSWEDVVAEYNKPGICDIVLNAQVLNGKAGFAAHRVVLIEINNKEVIFHDPNRDGSGAYRRESITDFRHAFDATESPSLARYSTVQ